MTTTLFDWECHPVSESIILDHLEKACTANLFIENLQQQLLTQTSTRLFDWLDHIAIGYSKELEQALEEDGFKTESTTASYRILHHPGAQLPRIVMHEASPFLGIAVAVESIADFLMVRGMAGFIEGSPLSSYRRCCISDDGGALLLVVERRESNTIEPTIYETRHLEKYMQATEMWKSRPRHLEDENEAMEHTLAIAERMIDLIGQNFAAWIVLECEREFWESRNLAGQLQKNRQDVLGMGWANHDHHTFRSSRRQFGKLVRLFEVLGFQCRERFYAGKEAGWGAQVMEHSGTRLVLFLDVDLLSDEIEVDYRHQPLKELKEAHTVGLWCGLHGDSILNSGMHHLEAQFMFEELQQALASRGVKTMEPFSNFPFLKQAFTKGEIWKVEYKRIQKLLEKELITQEQAEKFRVEGALGSHMENLQRRAGYKGFNKQNVSSIIKRTDPRNVNF